MRIFYVLFFAIALASCSRTGTFVPAGLPNGAQGSNSAAGSQPSLTRQPSGGHGYRQLYAFNGASGGAGYPVASLIAVNGELYGTTEEGGAAGFGTVFKVTKSGKERVVHSFGGPPDGSYPTASLVALNGTLYGTTEGGGSGCSSGSGACGTVFTVSTSGAESVLYSFKGGTDGVGPAAGLIAVNGEFYGTTTGGGTVGGGTAFKVSTSGSESVVHSFRGGLDGAYPYAGLTALHGALYGTTFGGGLNYGMVFKMSMSGKVHAVYSFNPNNGMDGNAPTSGVTALNGMLYGTTQYGGTNGYGAVYKVSTSGEERVLSSNVDDPQCSLIAVNGELYGTTYAGGFGFGTVFKISTSGKESLLYNFGGNPDGSAPAAGLLAENGVLYGTTESGGPENVGTVFKISP